MKANSTPSDEPQAIRRNTTNPDKLEPEKSQALLSYSEIVQRCRMIDRAWLFYLTHFEFCVVHFIFDRTAGWRKEWERISMKQFTQGVRDSDGQLHARLNSSSRGSVGDAIKSLIEKGVLLRRKKGQKDYEYSLNYKWDPSQAVDKPSRKAAPLENRPVDRDDVPPASRDDDGPDCRDIKNIEKKKSLRRKTSSANLTVDAVRRGGGERRLAGIGEQDHRRFPFPARCAQSRRLSMPWEGWRTCAD